MGFAELFLRLGSALVAWVVVFAHLVWLAALEQVSCGPDAVRPWMVLLGFSPITVLFACLLPVGATVPGVARLLRLPAVLLLVLVPLALRHIHTVFERTWSEQGSICTELAPSGFESWWSPAQLLVTIVIVVMAIVLWRRAGLRQE
ncbi:MAG: hypothetical protein AAF493_00890 [Pseudomonadota bacterium]